MSENITEERSAEVAEALESEGELNDKQTSALLVEAGYVDEPMPRYLPPRDDDARGPALARRVASLMRRPDGSDVGATKAEQEAWSAVLAAHVEYLDAVRNLKAINDEKGEEDKAADDVVAQQLRKGEAPRAPAGTDWVQVERTRRAIVRVAAEAVQVARTAYDKVAMAERPKRSKEAISRLKSAEAEMRRVAPGALAAVTEWLAARDLAVEVVEANDDRVADLGVIDEASRKVLSAGRQAIPALRALVESTHPAVTGHHLWEKFDVDPPMHVREWLAEQSDGFHVLAIIEVREHEAGKEISRLVRQLWSTVHPNDVAGSAPEWRRSALRK